MKKITKKYIEYLIAGLGFNNLEAEEIHNNDINNVYIKDEKIMGFRFFTKDIIIEDSKVYEGKRENISNWYYIGTPMNKKEIEKFFKNNKEQDLYKGLKAEDVAPEINLYSLDNVETFCMTRCGILIPITKYNVILNEDKKEPIIHNLKTYKNIEKYLGKYITCKRFENGILYSYTGRLQMVIPNDKIVLSNIQIPFISYETAIYEINKGREGEILYQNPYIEKNKKIPVVNHVISHKNDFLFLEKNEEEGYKIIENEGIARKKKFYER